MVKKRKRKFSGGQFPLDVVKEPPYYAYAWFRRVHRQAPGNWELCGAISMPQVIRHLDMHKHLDIPEPGTVIYGRTMATRHDYLYLRIELPEEMYKNLEEV
jgi:hypothetical protein